ncbi:MAG: hypothetical protein CM1200mP2_11020 [Planctomycetaceae bacterium]|nr:MAG: hypothetical protein CM1200mP2_11020 [Planctomycetaceae bacterium]
MLEEIIIETASEKARPKYIEIKSQAQVARTGSRPYVGSIPDFGSDGKKGYAISGVSPGSPAQKAGLKGGISSYSSDQPRLAGWTISTSLSGNTRAEMWST